LLHIGRFTEGLAESCVCQLVVYQERGERKSERERERLLKGSAGQRLVTIVGKAAVTEYRFPYSTPRTSERKRSIGEEIDQPIKMINIIACNLNENLTCNGRGI